MRVLFSIAILATLFGFGCKGDAPTPAANGAAAAGPQKVVIYSGRSESLVGPLLKALEADTGVAIEVQYGKTPELVTRLLTEGAESPADIIFAQDAGYLGALSNKGLLETLPEATQKRVETQYRDEKGAWVGTSGRLRVLVVNTDAVPEADRPKSLKDLADPKWKGKLGWAPTNGSLHAHISALRATWGEAETKAWLQAVIANAPRAYPKNSPQVAAAHTGEIAIGWVNHYYLHRAMKPGFKAANHRLANNDAGNLLMVSGVGIRKGSPNQAAALKVIEWLTSEKAQKAFAFDNFEYPTVPGMPTHADVPKLDPATLLNVPQSALSDVAPTRKMLQELGLL